MAYKKATTYTQLTLDPRVDWVSDERGTEEGIWVYLKEGFINTHLECGTIHEHTVAECCDQLNNEVVDNRQRLIQWQTKQTSNATP